MKTSDRKHIRLDVDGSEIIMLHFALYCRARQLRLLGRGDDSERCMELLDKLGEQAGIGDPFVIEGVDV